MRYKKLLYIITLIPIFFSCAAIAGVGMFFTSAGRMQLTGDAWLHFEGREKFMYLSGFFDANQVMYKSFKSRNDASDYDCGGFLQYSMISRLISDSPFEGDQNISWEHVYEKELDAIFANQRNNNIKINDAIYVVTNKLLSARLKMPDYTEQFIDHLRSHVLKPYIEIKDKKGNIIKRICFP